MRKFWYGFSSGIFSIVLLLVIIKRIHFSSNLFSIFFNRYHEFQWSSLIVLTILFSVITLYVNTSSSSSLNHQKLVADNIAKSRIEWLNVTRKYVSDYISAVNETYYFSVNILDINDKDSENEFSRLIADVENKYYLVRLSINPKENISKLLDRFLEVAYGTVSKYDKDDLNSELGEELQIFFKNEWEKAKSEIKTGEISPNDV